MLKEYVKKPCEGVKEPVCDNCDWNGGWLSGHRVCLCPSEPHPLGRRFEVSNDDILRRTTVTSTEFLTNLLSTPRYLVPKEYEEAYDKGKELHRQETHRHEEAIARIGIEILKDLPNVEEVWR